MGKCVIGIVAFVLLKAVTRIHVGFVYSVMLDSTNMLVLSNIILSMHMFSNVIKPCMKPSMNNKKIMFTDLTMSIP